MAKPLHFKNPPIQEAIIAVQVIDLPVQAVEKIRELNERVKDTYPARVDLTHTSIRGEIGAQGATTSTQQRVGGLQFQSTDGKQIFQARLNGFSFHRLAPYETWQSFRNEAFRLWRQYREVIGPVEIVNFSVRYINTLTVPAPAKLEDYVNIYPSLPSDFPQVMQNFFMRVELPLADDGSGIGLLTVTETMLPSAPGTATVLLDNTFAYTAGKVSDELLWKRIDAVQAVKNRLFLAALTPNMQRRIS